MNLLRLRNHVIKYIIMEENIIIAFLTALVGGLIGTYGGARFLNLREDYKMKKVRAMGTGH